jgi:hypothetical protein
MQILLSLGRTQECEYKSHYASHWTTGVTPKLNVQFWVELPKPSGI